MPKNDFLDNQGNTEQSIVLPKHSHWWVLVVAIILIALAGGGWYFWNQQKVKSIDSFAECREQGGALLESYPEQCSINGKSFPNPDQQAQEPPATVDDEPQVEEPKLASYTDTTNSFSIQYPADFVQAKKEVTTPYTNAGTEITSENFSHTILVKYCNPKGDCFPNTTDISMAFTVVNSSLATIEQSKIKGELKDFTAGSNKFRYFSQGVEGEGIYYYFISLPNKKTLMVSRTYIDETILSSYKTAKDFITKANQDKLVEQILASLNFTTLQTYESKTYNFSIQIPQDWKATTDKNGLVFVSESLRVAAEENEKNCKNKVPNKCAPEFNASDLNFVNTSYKKDVLDPKTIKTKTIGGKQFTLYQTPGLFSNTYYEIEYKGKIYNFTTYSNVLIERILETLKFLN